MKWLQTLSIRRLILLFMLLMALPAIGLIIHAGLQDRKDDLNEASRASTYLLNNIASELQSKVDASRQLMEVLSYLPEVRQRNSMEVNRLLADLIREHPIYTNILIVDRSGTAWAGNSTENKSINVADRKAFIDAMATGNFSAGEYIVGRSSQKAALNFAFPLKNSQGNTDGAILCGLNTEQIGSLSKVGNLPSGTSFGIFDHKGVFLYRTIDPSKFIGKKDKQNTFEQMQNGPDEGVLDLISNDGIHRISAYRKIRLAKDQPPYAYVRGGTPTEIMIQKANTNMFHNLAVMIIVLLLVLAMNLLLGKRLIVDRIAKLKAASDQLAVGDFKIHVSESVQGGELGRLGKAFEDMAQKLLEYMHERNQAAEEYQAIVQTTTDGFNICDIQGRIIETNNAFCTMLGYSRQELLGKHISDIDVLDDDEIVAGRINKIMVTGADSFQSKHRRKDGSTLDVDITITYLKTKGGRLISFVRDVTERKQSEIELRQREQALANSERFLKTIIDTEPECIKLLDSNCNLLMMNPAGLEMIQADSFEQVKGQCVCPLITTSNRDAFFALTKQVFQGVPGSLTFESVGLKGRHVWLETHAVPFRNEHGEIVALLGITRNITDRKKSEEALQSTKAKFSAIFQTSPDSININRLEDAIFVDVNEGFTAMLGYSAADIIGKPSTEIGVWVDSNDRARLAHQLKEMGEVKNLETRLRRKDGTLLTALVSSRLIELDGVLCTLNIARDITEIKHAEQEKLKFEKQLFHTQKLESLGVLAGGIAHDFNNILTSIIGNTDLALMKIDPTSPVVDNLHKIEMSAVKAAGLANQMLAYSGKGQFVIETIDLNRLLEDMGHMLGISISKNVVLQFNLMQSLPTVEVDATQIRQIVMNLLINASEAIGEKSGTIVISTGCIDCNTSYLNNSAVDKSITAGRYVFLEIDDNGCGMDKETLAKVFEPFFTTKFTGRGLGMAAVQGIVRGHGGFINVYSEPDKGTTFKVFLPESGKLIKNIDDYSYRDDWKCSGKVLLVDDEEIIRDIGQEMLNELGLNVITANDGKDAIEMFKAIPDIDIIILDLTMPNMDGEQCFYELRKLDPGIKVIMSSGFSESEVTKKFAGKGISGFIQKPYNMSVLKEAIQKI